MFFFGSIYINKEQKIYTIKIDNNHGPKEFILDKLSKEIKSKTIGLTDERLYKYIKNELNKKQLNSNVIKSLLGDIRYAKNKNSNNYFIHFAGKFKPWQVSGTVITGSELFQNNYEIINNANPYIQIKNRRNSTKQLFSFLFLKRLLKNENRLNILYKIISEIILKRNIS